MSNGHYALFRYAMTRPGDTRRSGHALTAVFVCLVIAAAVAVPFFAG